MERRCRLRAGMMADEENRSNWTRPEIHHWNQNDWRKLITPDDLPGLNYWRPGTDLPRLSFTSHLAKPHIRAAQRLAHSFCLPLLDRLRRPYSEDVYPQRIKAETLTDNSPKCGRATE